MTRNIYIVCEKCDKGFDFPATPEQMHALDDSSKSIQDIFPELSSGERELFISGMCGECFDKVFEAFEEWSEA